jgi:2-iminobutanoate/2-iminopropanoate deaminase
MSFQTIIASENAPKAIGPYSPALCVNGLVLFSGQIPINPASGQIEADTIEGQTHQVLKNIGALLKEAGLDYSNVVKTTVFLSDIADFAAMNKVYGEYFVAPYPTRSCVQVGALPMNAKVEIEVMCTRGTLPFEKEGC